MNTFASKIIFPGILPEKGKFSSEESFSIEDWHQAVDHFDQNLHFCASSKVMLKKQEVQNQNLLLLILEALSPEAEKTLHALWSHIQRNHRQTHRREVELSHVPDWSQQTERERIWLSSSEIRKNLYPSISGVKCFGVSLL